MSESDKKSRVGGIVLDGQHNLLIVLSKHSNKWGVPKGALEDNETFVQGALREIKEETGLNLQPECHKNLAYWGVNRARLYILQVDEIKPKLKPKDKVEITQASWLNLDDPESVTAVSENANKMLLAVIKKLKYTLQHSSSN